MSNNNNKMLIDATHPEETRVVVLRNGRVEEFDFESAARKLLRGNIYLAKVTRVEPSLQAAFVDYGGNRHGFLAFNEIHPDYYQIPVADRQALLEEEAAQEAAEEAEVDAHAERLARRREARQGSQGGRGAPREREAAAHDNEPQFIAEPDDVPEPVVIEGGEIADPHRDEPEGHAHDDHSHDDRSHDDRDVAEAPHSIAVDATAGDAVLREDAVAHDEAPHEGHDHSHDHDHPHEAAHEAGHHEAHDHEHHHHEAHDAGHDQPVAEVLEPAGNEDVVEEMPQRPRRRPRSYKIQEVIKRRQVILVQVVKEERGNKGAALTTYLSLAGRYTVLMPNTARGGGISRKITQPGDRKRLKAIANELEVPEGMGLIIRTAGASRTSQEIKRDFEYLLRLWESVRELTLASTAPSLVYEEGNLIKRSIRDLYTKDVEEVVVAGEPAHREARDFMRMLMPSHAQNVIEYRGGEPLFTRYRMEQQLAAMFSPQVTLKSGGYLVINQTEALVAIDVNSGKSTREYSIEETAYSTNIEAADEIARQLKLRDLAGLIVIDFIDMDDKRNIRGVERRLKDALRFDRARIQLGRISHFGLMEMSRQRLRTGVLEGSTSQCPHCQGTGIIRSVESVALAVLRGLEDALMAGTRMALVATTTPQVALYILNSKRGYIVDMEARHGLAITIQGSDKLQGANFTIDKVAAAPSDTRRRPSTAVNMEWGFEGEGEDQHFEGGVSEVGYDEPEDDNGQNGERDRERGPRHEASGEDDGNGGRRRRRRGRRGRRDDRGDNGNGNGDRGERHAGHAGHAGHGTGGDFTPVDGEDSGQQDHDERPDELSADAAYDDTGEGADGVHAPQGEGEGAEGGRRRRRRGRRGGRRGGRDRAAQGAGEGAVGEDFASGSDGEPHADNDTGEQLHGDAVVAAAEEAASVAVPGSHADDNHTGGSQSEPAAKTAHATRHRHKEAEAAPEVVAGVSEAVEVTVASSDAVATSEAPAAVVPAAPAPVVVEVPVAPVVAEEAPAKPARRVSSGSSEPVLERVVVSPHAAGTAEAAEGGEAKPARKGWWQRKLGLD